MLFMACMLFGAAFRLAAQGPCPSAWTVSLTTGMWGVEVAWTLQDGTGNAVASGQNYPDNFTQNVAVCSSASCFVLILEDSFGDGWNGGSIELTAPDGVLYGPYTLETGSIGVLTVGAGDCPAYFPGCTDAAAYNYNPEATWDDGSCVLPPACADGSALVVLTASGADPWSTLGMNVTGPAGEWIPVNSTQTPGAGVTNWACVAPGCHTYTVWGGWGENASGTLTWESGAIPVVLDPMSGSVLVGLDVYATESTCTPAVWGCTDAEASNFQPNATNDDGSCTYPLDCGDGELVHFYLCTFNQGEEVAFTLFDAVSGDTLFSQNGFNTFAIVHLDLCIPEGACLTAVLENTGPGTGWYGGYVTLTTSTLNYFASLPEGQDSATQTGVAGDGCGSEGAGNGAFSWPEPIGLTAWPNPTEEVVNVVGEGFDAHFPVSVDVYDALGRKVYSALNSPESIGAIDVASWPSGVYRVVCRQQDLTAGATVIRR